MQNILNINSREKFREWLNANGDKESCCYLSLCRAKPKDDGKLYYLDAVEEALCFGWIDSTLCKIDGKSYQRFSPRQKNSLWTELNKERVRRLEKLGLMTESGKKVLPDMTKQKIVIPQDIKKVLVEINALDNFNNFPDLYKRVRLYNLNFYKTKLPKDYDKALAHFIEATSKNKMYGQWNDYGRLLNY